LCRPNRRPTRPGRNLSQVLENMDSPREKSTLQRTWVHFVKLGRSATRPPIEKATRIDAGKPLPWRGSGGGRVARRRTWAVAPARGACYTDSISRRIGPESCPEPSRRCEVRLRTRAGSRNFSSNIGPGSERWPQMALDRVDTYLETHRSG